MFIVIVRHHVKPGLVDAAGVRIDGNGDRMAQLPGFLFRHRMIAKNDPLLVTTVTGWTEESCFDAWNKIKATLPDSGPSPYDRVETERHNVASSHAASNQKVA